MVGAVLAGLFFGALTGSSGARANTILLDNGHKLELNAATNKYHAILSYADESTQSHVHSMMQDSADHHIVSIEGLGLLGVGAFEALHVAELAGHSGVEVFPNGMMYPIGEYHHTDDDGDEVGEIRTQTNVSNWGIDRINQRELPLDSTYTWDVNPEVDDVAVIVMDSGIQASHPDWVPGQVEFIAECLSGGLGVCSTEPRTSIDAVFPDGIGHGTHCAGIVGSPTWGVAKGVKLYNIRIFDGIGGAWDSDIIAAIAEAIKFANARPKTRFVINMSFGGSSLNPFTEDILQLAYDAGIVMVAAAGNDGEDTCGQQPAAFPQTIAVGATAANDTTAYFTNHGPCTDINAPGYNIPSTNAGWDFVPDEPCKEDTDCAFPSECLEDGTCKNPLELTISGTSMAAPHVAGAAALILIKQPYLTPEEVLAELIQTATEDVILDVKPETPNLLLYVGDFALPDWSVSHPTHGDGDGSTSPNDDSTSTSQHDVCPNIRPGVAHYRGKRGAYNTITDIGIGGCCSQCGADEACESFTVQGPVCYLYDAPFDAERELPCSFCASGDTTMPGRVPDLVPPPPLPEVSGDLTCDSSFIASNVGAKNVVGNPSGDLLYTFTIDDEDLVDDNFHMLFDTCSPNTNFDTVIRLFADPELLVPLGVQDNTPIYGASEVCAGGKSQMFLGHGNATFYVVVEGAGSEEGQFEFTLTCAPLNPDELPLPEIECGMNVRDRIFKLARSFNPYSVSQTFKLTVPEGDGLEVQFDMCTSYTDFWPDIWVYEAYNFPNSTYVGEAVLAADGDGVLYPLRGSSCGEPGNHGARLTGVVPPGVYYVFIGQWRDEGNYELNVNCGEDIVPLPLGPRPENIEVECGSNIQGSTDGAVLLLPNSTAAGVVVHAFTTDAVFPENMTQEVTFSTCDAYTNYDTSIVAYADEGLTEEIATVNRAFCPPPVGRNALATWVANTLEPNTTYYVAVTGPWNYEGNYNLEVTCDYVMPPPPTPEMM